MTLTNLITFSCLCAWHHCIFIISYFIKINTDSGSFTFNQSVYATYVNAPIDCGHCCSMAYHTTGLSIISSQIFSKYLTRSIGFLKISCNFEIAILHKNLHWYNFCFWKDICNLFIQNIPAFGSDPNSIFACTALLHHGSSQDYTSYVCRKTEDIPAGIIYWTCIVRERRSAPIRYYSLRVAWWMSCFNNRRNRRAPAIKQKLTQLITFLKYRLDNHRMHTRGI